MSYPQRGACDVSKDSFISLSLLKEYGTLRDMSKEIHVLISQVREGVENLLENNDLDSALYVGSVVIESLFDGLNDQQTFNEAVITKIEEIRNSDDDFKREVLLASREEKINDYLTIDLDDSHVNLRSEY